MKPPRISLLLALGLSHLSCGEVAEVLRARGDVAPPANAGESAGGTGTAGKGGGANGGGANAGGVGDAGGAGDAAGTDAGAGGAQPENPDLGVFVDSGDAHSCAARFGILYCWGDNSDGRLGSGDELDHDAPVRVGYDADWITVATGVAHSCALKSDGSVWCFGANTFGQLGQGHTQASNLPLRVTLPGPALQLSAQVNTACAVLRDGTLYCWGRNWEGNIGLDDTHPGVDQLLPIRSGQDSDWVLTGTGDGHTCGIRDGGSLFGWGRNTAANLGLGQTVDQQRRAATPIGSEQDWVGVVSGQDASCGIRSGGLLFCWGENSFGTLGFGDREQRLVPEQVAKDRVWAQISIDTFHGCGIDADQTLHCWGRNIEGQLGTSDLEDRLSPADVGSGFQQVAAGRMFSCAATPDGRVFCTGENVVGQLGLGDTERRNSFTEVSFP